MAGTRTLACETSWGSWVSCVSSSGSWSFGWFWILIYPWRIHGAAIYANMLPSIYPLYVSIYIAYMDPSWDIEWYCEFVESEAAGLRWKGTMALWEGCRGSDVVWGSKECFITRDLLRTLSANRVIPVRRGTELHNYFSNLYGKGLQNSTPVQLQWPRTTCLYCSFESRMNNCKVPKEKSKPSVKTVPNSCERKDVKRYCAR